MDNFRMALNSTCTSKSIIDKIEQAGLLPGVNNPVYSDILVALSDIGYICYAVPVESLASASGMAWCPEVVYRKNGDAELKKLSFPYFLSIHHAGAIEDAIEASLDIILDKN